MTYEPFDNETIETVAGTYTVEWVYDEGPEQPYDYGWTLYITGRERYIDDIDVTDAEEKNAVPDIVRDYWTDTHISGHTILRYLSLLGLRAKLVDADYYLVDADDDRASGIVIAPHDIPAEHVEKSFDNFLSQWRAWADGDVFGWRVLDPSGEEIDAVWGYYGFDRERAYTLSEARDAIACDIEYRAEKSNLVGAGFVGLI